MCESKLRGLQTCLGWELWLLRVLSQESKLNRSVSWRTTPWCSCFWLVVGTDSWLSQVVTGSAFVLLAKLGNSSFPSPWGPASGAVISTQAQMWSRCSFHSNPDNAWTMKETGFDSFTMVAETQLGLGCRNREQEQTDQPAKSTFCNGCHVAVSEVPGLRPLWLLDRSTASPIWYWVDVPWTRQMVEWQ